MKNIFHYLVLSFFFFGCEGEPTVQQEQIDVTSEEAKEAIDKLANQAKKFLEGDDIDKIKNVIDELADKGKGMTDDSKIWKEKIENLKNDEDIKELLKKVQNEGKEMETKLENFSKALEDDPVLKRQVENIKNTDDLNRFLKSYEGPAKTVLQDIEKTLRKFEDNGVLKKKIEDLENDQELRDLLKKYESDGKEIIEKIEDIFGN